MTLSRKGQKKFGASLFVVEAVLLALAALSGSAALGFWFFSRDLPSPALLTAIEIPESTKIYDRSGETLLYEIRGEYRRTIVALEKISKFMRDASIVTEDADFYRHGGISGRGIARALYENLRAGRVVQGGSSITQQLVKNLFLTPERTLTRKLRETILALEIEGRFSKEEILALYLNTVPYGANAYGVEAAAQTYFGKSVESITLLEAAYLAALPRAPSYYSPYGSHVAELGERARHVLRRMREFGYISEEELNSALDAKVAFSGIRDPILAPHFVFYVREFLEARYGGEFLERGGLRIITTLDAEIQKKAEEAVAKWGETNEARYNATNAALVAQDPKTGDVLAMVGSRNYFDTKRGGNFNVAISPHRQPGSAIKPIVYATAFEKGFSDKTIVFDLPTEFDVSGLPQNSYRPENYDGKYLGPITLRTALAQSRNTPSVKVLYLAGLDAVRQKAEELGITTLKDPSRYGLSLVLGGAEVRLVELVGAYAALANDGVFVPQRLILRIERANGERVEDFDVPHGRRVWSVETARLVGDILKDNEARAPIFGSRSPLYFDGRDVTAKTGTTQNFWDAWAVGYTPSFVVGVWTGNNDRTPMLGIGGGAAGLFTAGPIFHDLMAWWLETKFSESFLPPAEPLASERPMLNGNWKIPVTVAVNKENGKRANSLTPPRLVEERSYEDVHSILYYVDPKDPAGTPPARPELDPQFRNWEGPVRKWAREQGINLPPEDYDT